MNIKAKILLIILVSINVAFEVSCTKGDSWFYMGSLERLNWSKKNYEVLDHMINNYGKGGEFYNKFNG